MSPIVPRLMMTALLAFGVASCNRESSTAPAQENAGAPAAALGQTASGQTAAAPDANAPAPIPPATEMPVDKVESLMVTRAPDSPESVIIRASGSVASGGWTDAKLTPMEASAADARTRVFSFVATSPGTPAEDHTPQSVETELRVDGVPAELHTIRVIAATNAISAPVLQ